MYIPLCYPGYTLGFERKRQKRREEEGITVNNGVKVRVNVSNGLSMGLYPRVMREVGMRRKQPSRPPSVNMVNVSNVVSRRPWTGV